MPPQTIPTRPPIGNMASPRPARTRPATDQDRPGTVAVSAIGRLQLVPVALAACDEIEDLLDEFDRWADAESVRLLEAPDDIKRYRKAYLDQVRQQLKVTDG